MSKTRKHQAQYDYLHGTRTVKGKLLWGVLNKFWRWNSERRYFIPLRNKKRYAHYYRTKDEDS